MVVSIPKYVHSADGTKIYADATGDPRNPHVVLIHGMGVPSIAWDRQVEDPRLNENLYLVRYDTRGQGRSGSPLEASAYASERQAEDFKAVCDGFNLVRPHIVAWSLGSIIIVDVIERYGGDYIGNIVYCGGPLLTRELHNNYIHPTLLGFIPEVLSTDADVVADVAPRYIASTVEDVDKVYTYREQLMCIGSFCSMIPTSRRHLILRTQPTERWEKEIKAKEILLIQGTHDPHSQTDKLLVEADKWLGGYEKRILEGCGHTPAVERPHEVNGFVLSFFKRHPVE